MSDVSAGNDENFENLLKRFNRKVQRSGIFSDLKDGEYYEKPSAKKKRRDSSKKRKSEKEE